MARKPSVVITPAEQKAIAKQLKLDIATAKGAVKAQEKLMKDAEKAFNQTKKEIEKAMGAAAKQLAKLEAQVPA